MIKTERELATIAEALISDSRPLAIRPMLDGLRKEIRQGQDPLGTAFCKIRSSKQRRTLGATYTPQAVVDAMVAWAATNEEIPARVVDAGAGSGRFIAAAARAFPQTKLIAVEIDPLAVSILRANATVLGFSHRLVVKQIDYRLLKLSKINGRTLFIGNPPYVRHHDIERSWKIWLAETAESLGFSASGLSGLHIHFFLKTRAVASPGDFGAFITASEWLDVNYGSIIREMLADGLGGTSIHVIDPKTQVFSDALATGTITCFRVGQRSPKLTMRVVESLGQLAPLTQGRDIDWGDLNATSRWSTLIRKTPARAHGHIEIGELFRVHRGQVSGNNAVWIAGPNAAGLPRRFLFPTVTRASELFAAGAELHTHVHLRRVIDLPADLSALTDDEHRAVDHFLAWARKNGAHDGWIASNRQAWWAVNLRSPAPILCTYMARRSPAFVFNRAQARHINIAHGLYPLEPLSDTILKGIVRYLRNTVDISGGRIYAGGLVKFEPGEVQRLHIPPLKTLVAEASL